MPELPNAAPMPATPIGQLAAWHLRCVCVCGRRTTYALRDLAGVHGPDLPDLTLWRLTGRLRCGDCRRPPVRVSLLDGVEEARTVRGIRETVILNTPPPGRNR
jgi:hypothetical protein